MTCFVKSFQYAYCRGWKGRYPGLLNFPRALSLEFVCMLGIICASLVLLHLPQQHSAFAVQNGRKLFPFSPPPNIANIAYYWHTTNIEMLFPGISLYSAFQDENSVCGKRDSPANHTEPYSTLSIYMNASHMPHSMRNIKQLHSSLFQNSYPAAWFPGVVALLCGNRPCRLPAQAIRFAENRLKHQTASDHTDSRWLLGRY